MRKLFFFFLVVALSCSSPDRNSYTLEFGPSELYNGKIAQQLRLSPDKTAVVLEGRNFKAPYRGLIESDQIDPLNINNLSIPESMTLKSVEIRIDATIPDGSAVDLYLSFGNNYFSTNGWSDWKKEKTLFALINNPPGKYLRFQLVMSAPEIGETPEILSVTINVEPNKTSLSFKKELEILQFDNEQLITSQYAFAYERQDNEYLTEFIEQMGYNALVSNANSDLEKLFMLNTTVASTFNYERGSWAAGYPFDPREICSMQNGKMAIRGHCMSYAVVLINSLTAFGYYSRHWAANGLRDMDHEVVEVWVDSLRKWIYLDPSLSQYYIDPQTKTPLSLKEMHDIYIQFVLKPGETLLSVPDETLKARVKAKGPKKGMLAPIDCIDSGWHYGKKTDPASYDWGWLHGYMVSGFLRLTERNNYVSEKEPLFSHFGDGINFNNHWHWVDDATPPRMSKIQTYTGRERDLWWSMNQAAMKATRTGKKSISLEFGNTQPFFMHYLISIDGASASQISGHAYNWALHSGENDIVVTPVDEFGNRGISSHLRLRK